MARRVLVVEDDLLNSMFFCEVLLMSGFEPIAVTDGREAIARARESEPHLIIMDIQLPHMSGFDLIPLLKADSGLRHVPVLAVTGVVGRDVEERIIATGAEDYMSKPVAVAPLQNAAARLALPEGWTPGTPTPGKRDRGRVRMWERG